MKPFPLCLSLAFVLLAGCATTYAYNEDSPDTKVPAGSVLALTKSITIPPGRRSVYILGGRVVSFNDVNIYYPYCQFRLRKIGDHPRVVQPGSFRVLSTKQWDEYSQNRPRVRLAAAGGRGGAGTGVDARAVMNDGGPSIISQATILKLASQSEPQVDDMVCQHWGDQGQTPHLTIHQIRDTLAPLFELRVQRPPSKP